MKYLTLLVLITFFSGCFYQTTNSYDLEEAEELCKDKGGIAEIFIRFWGTESVICKNNIYFELHREVSK